MVWSLKKDSSIAWWRFFSLEIFDGRGDRKVFINGVPALSKGGFSRGMWHCNELFSIDVPPFVQ